jgi:hypothetical protein
MKIDPRGYETYRNCKEQPPASWPKPAHKQAYWGHYRYSRKEPERTVGEDKPIYAKSWAEYLDE